MEIFLLIASVVLMIILSSRWDVHPFLSLLLASMFYALLSGMPLDLIIESINQGFGSILGQIGLIIVIGVIIGSFLENSGGAYKLADIILGLIGRKNVYGGMGLIGFIVSIPVFADSGFIILSPLNRSISKKAGISIAGTATVLMLGLLISHVLVPPTPGPIAAAGILGADIGLVIITGLITGLLALPVAVLFSKKVLSRIYVDPNPEISEADIDERIRRAPGAVKSFLPILIPILLIVGKSVLELQYPDLDATGVFIRILSFLGTPVIALSIGMIISFTLPDKIDKKIFSSSGWIGKSIRDAASILLITGAGGIFGTILQKSEIAGTITTLLADINLGIWLPFILCAAIKTAQGSSTVALITTASIMVPLLPDMGFISGIEKALVVTAIGAGAAVVSHINDSGFWIMTRFSGLDVKTGYKTYTLGSLLVGTFAAFIVFLASLVV